MGQGNRRIVA